MLTARAMSLRKRQKTAVVVAGPTTDFMGFSSENTGTEEEMEEEDTEDDEEQSVNDVTAHQTEKRAHSPLPIDWVRSDLIVDGEVEMLKGGMILRRDSCFPGAWGLARGSRTAFQGRHIWQLKLLRLPEDSKDSISPKLLFGVLVQWPGCQPMPGPSRDGFDQPVLVLLADTGEHVFSSNLSPKLLRAPLFQKPLQEGDLIDIIADFGLRRLQFRRGGETGEAKPLPVRRDAAGRGSRVSNRLRETAYHFFVALQCGVEVELLDTSPPLPNQPQASKSIEAIVLAGPPGSGKSTWAAEFAKAEVAKGGYIQVLGEEWLHHRMNFFESPSPKVDDKGVEMAEVAHLGDEGRQALAESIMEAFSLFADADGSEDMEQSPGFDSGSNIGRQPSRPEESEEKSLTEAQSIQSTEVSWRPGNLGEAGKQNWAPMLPQLLRRAAARSVSIMADGCHLQASFRAELRAALLHFPGRVRWMVVIPHTFQELIRRQGESKACEDTKWLGSTLPGTEGGNFSIHAVEFAEGRDPKVFQMWLEQFSSEVDTNATQSHTTASSQTAQAGMTIMQTFFTKFGDPTGYLSTEGMRRY